MERRATEPDRRTHDIPGETGEEAELALLRSVGLADPAGIQPVGPIPDDDDGVNDRPEALEEHEVPGYRAEDDLDWPIITSDPKWLLDHGESRETPPGRSAPGDWLDRAKRAHGVVEPGTYDVEILPRGIRPIPTAKTDGVSFLVGIVGGDRDGFECRLNFLTDGPENLQRIVRRDLLILAALGAHAGRRRHRQRRRIDQGVGPQRRGPQDHAWPRPAGNAEWRRRHFRHVGRGGRAARWLIPGRLCLHALQGRGSGPLCQQADRRQDRRQLREIRLRPRHPLVLRAQDGERQFRHGGVAGQAGETPRHHAGDGCAASRPQSVAPAASPLGGHEPDEEHAGAVEPGVAGHRRRRLRRARALGAGGASRRCRPLHSRRCAGRGVLRRRVRRRGDVDNRACR